MSDTVGMNVNEFKRKFRASSGWPNVQRAVEERQQAAKDNKREQEMLKAGAQVARRGPGRPPKSEGSDE